MTASARKVNTATKVRHRPIDTEQFVMPAQLLALRVDQQQDRTPGVSRHSVQHHTRLTQSQRKADRRVIRRAYHGQGLPFEVCASAQKIAIAAHIVRAAEKM